MPKIVEYPRRSLSDALKLAETVSSLGGKCSIETCAESMERGQWRIFLPKSVQKSFLTHVKESMLVNISQ